MILSYRDKRSSDFASGKRIKDLAALPGNRFEALKGDRKGQYSIRINDQWRICFEWGDGASGPSNVEIVDYH
jgi:toxin HigB-1